MFETPILFLVFNRPSYTKQVFEAIRSVRPKQLFIAADGPREKVPEDNINCQSVKDIVSNIDWDCEVKTLYREKNLGCGLAPSSAIKWFFDNVDQGIILEDDCLPSSSFFPFCQEMLELYKNDLRIHSIGGTNFFEKWNRGDDSYFFSNESGIWGWATWKRSWDEYDYFVSKWKNPEVAELFKLKFENSIYKDVFVEGLNDLINNEGVSFWDYQFVFSRIINSQFGIVPSLNLISNIGFGSEATHTFNEDSLFSKIPAYELLFPLIHPKAIMIDLEYDRLKVDKEYVKPVKRTLTNRIINKLKKKIKK
jgi:hypothetical protein